MREKQKWERDLSFVRSSNTPGGSDVMLLEERSGEERCGDGMGEE